MGGIFSKSNRPTLPGAYFNFEAEAAPSIPASPGTTVAIPFVHNWGPFEEPVRVRSFAEFQNVFGGSDNTDGFRAVRQAFLGEGVDGRNGAGEVLCYRFGGASAAKASVVLNDTDDSAAITLTARYEGTRGNDLRITTQDFAGDATKNELIILDGAKVLERFFYADADIEGLAAQINQRSDWVTAGSVEDGVALDNVSAEPLTGGNDGATLLAADWVAAMTAFSTFRFAAFCAYKLTDSSIRASVAAWTEEQNTLGNRFFSIFGGAANENVSTAIARSQALESANCLNVGVGSVSDSTLGAGQTAQTLSTAEFAARVAGVLAARGEFQSLTHARFSGVELVGGATLSELEEAFDGGVISLARDSHPTAPVHIKTGLTTWTQDNADSDPARPYLIYRQPKYVRTIHGIERDLTQWAEENIIGLRIINDQTRDAVVAEVKRRLAEREALGAVQAGWSVGIDQNPPPSDDDEFIALTISASFARALEQVYFTVSVG